MNLVLKQGWNLSTKRVSHDIIVMKFELSLALINPGLLDDEIRCVKICLNCGVDFVKNKLVLQLNCCQSF